MFVCSHHQADTDCDWQQTLLFLYKLWSDEQREVSIQVVVWSVFGSSGLTGSTIVSFIHQKSSSVRNLIHMLYRLQLINNGSTLEVQIINHQWTNKHVADSRNINTAQLQQLERTTAVKSRCDPSAGAGVWSSALNLHLLTLSTVNKVWHKLQDDQGEHVPLCTVAAEQELISCVSLSF